MEDIEKEISGEEENGEEYTIKFNKKSNDNKKRNIIITILVVIAILLAGLMALLIFNQKDDKKEAETKQVNTDSLEEEKETKNENKNFFYVSCDDNTSLLNVRNSTTGDIIDGLSCYKKVEILEEVAGTDNCDKWYRVSYEKHNNSYTGYVCSKYIKESQEEIDTMKNIRAVIDKANKYYEDNQALVYCGETSGTKTINIQNDNSTFEGQYAKSQFKTLEELKEHILTFLDESLIKNKLELSDSNNPKMYDNYFEIDGNLYCRNYSGKGWLTYYTGNYDIEIESNTDSKVKVKIVYEYINEEKLNEDSKCSLDNLSSCPNSYLKYVIGSVTLSKENNNYKVIKMDFHD